MGLPTLLVPGSLAGEAGGLHPGMRPVDYILQWVKKRLPSFGSGPPRAMADRVLIVRSRTGSGKSTVLPAELLRLLRAKGESAQGAARRVLAKQVICTQPRVLTAKELAKDLANDQANYPDLVLGQTVGYQTGDENYMPKMKGLVYATAGVLQCQLQSKTDQELFDSYQFIVVDEAHERSLDTDLLIMGLKQMLARNLGNAKAPFVILTSATIDPQKYVEYFGVSPGNVVDVTGSTFPKTKHFTPGDVGDYIKCASATAVRLHEEGEQDDPERGDIMIFMPGKKESKKCREILAKSNAEYKYKSSRHRPYCLLEINSDVVRTDAADYRLMKALNSELKTVDIDGDVVQPKRKIILATSVAETGLTINSLKYVVDPGWCREPLVDFPSGAAGLVTTPTPHSRAEQRCGRVGRKFPGECYPLYTHASFDRLTADQLPEIVTKGVGEQFLQVAFLAAKDNVVRLGAMDLLDPPPVDALADAFEKSVRFGYLRATPGALAKKGHEFTPLGLLAHRLEVGGVPMEQSQVVFAAFMYAASVRDAVALVALSASPDIYRLKPSEGRTPHILRGRYKAAMRDCMPGFFADDPVGGANALKDDFITGLAVFNKFSAKLSAEEDGGYAACERWCRGLELNFEALTDIAARRQHLLEALLTVGINPYWGERHALAAQTEKAEFMRAVRALKLCLYAGYQGSFARRCQEGGGYAHLSSGLPVGLRPVGPLHMEGFVTDKYEITAESVGKASHYVARANLISSTDGHVGLDIGAREPRAGEPAAPATSAPMARGDVFTYNEVLLAMERGGQSKTEEKASM